MELALCLPFVVLLLGLLVEIGFISADQIRLHHASRETARAAAVEPDPEDVVAAVRSSGLRGVKASFEPELRYRSQGEPLTVRLAYAPKARVPLLGDLLGFLTLHAHNTIRVEQP